MHGHLSEHTKDKGNYDRKIVLVGNPNVGKSVIFGLLTGTYATVSNYPGTTVEVSRGIVKINNIATSVIDSPGVNSLMPNSEDEVVTRNILLGEKVDSVVNVIDTKNLRRGLLVALQLSEMRLPTAIVLNMYDEAGERGISVDTGMLKAEFACEIIPSIATQRWGLDKIKNAAGTERLNSVYVNYPDVIEEGVCEIAGVLPQMNVAKRAVALMLVAGDRTLSSWLMENLDKDGQAIIREVQERVAARYSEPVGYIINKERLRRVDALVSKCITIEEKSKSPVATKIGELSMHPVWGLFMMALVLAFMYVFVGMFGAGTSVDFLETHIFGEYLNPWTERVTLAIFGEGFISDLIVGEYGLVTMALTYAVAIVLPIVGYFFIFFSFLEDSGYLPRLAVMVDKVFKLMGLNGKAVLPMVLGLGCATMATMTTRILETRKERIIVTLLLALGIPCSAQLGVILGMLGAVSLGATLIWMGSVVLVLFIVSYLASKIVPGDTSDFILEIPPIRMPKISNIILKTLVRVEWYLKEAVPLFILGTLVLFTLDKINALELIQTMAAPVIVGLLELPPKATEAFLIGFLRRDYGAAGLFDMQRSGMLDNIQVVVSLVTMTLFVPCIANFFMVIKERGMKAACYMALVIFPVALLAGGLLNFILRTFNINL
jgi:ferrous iron transport protein B